MPMSDVWPEHMQQATNVISMLAPITELEHALMLFWELVAQLLQELLIDPSCLDLQTL